MNGQVSGYKAGMIAGNLFGSSLSLSASTNGTVQGYDAGGLVGVWNYGGSISNSYSLANVLVVSSTNTVIAHDSGAGGIVGFDMADPSQSLYDCYAAGKISKEINMQSWAITSGVNNALEASASPNLQISSYYWDKQTTGVSTNSNPDPFHYNPIQGAQTTAQMFNQSTYVGWDFKSIWVIDNGHEYPQLQWQAASICGDGIITGRESCDGNNLGAMTCKTLGYHNGGTLKCSSQCQFDTSSCIKNLPNQSLIAPTE